MLETKIILPTDKIAIAQASAWRKPEDYTPESLAQKPYTMPVVVLRTLANKRSVLELNAVPDIVRARIQAEHDATVEIGDIRLEITRHLLHTPEASFYRPLSFAEAFTYQGIRVRGRYVSDLHNIVTSDLSTEEKVAIVEGITGQYKALTTEADVTIASMPKRKYQDHSLALNSDNSITHTLMLRVCDGADFYREEEIAGMVYGFYFIANDNPRSHDKRRYLLNDPKFMIACAELNKVANNNFKREIQLVPPDQKDIGTVQIAEGIALLAQSERMRRLIST